MNNFTISQLAQFSGVKAHTIRIWEQRYRALEPQRSEGNTRYYTDEQLRRLLNLVSLMDSGRRISDLAALKDRELFELLKQQLPKDELRTELPDKGFFISQLVAAGMSYDAPGFEKILTHCLLRFGMTHTYTEVIYPMLSRIGLLWASNELPPAQEHFISNLLRQKLFTAIDSLPLPPSDAPSWLLFLPENEFHELGLLMTDYLLKLKGQRSLYLGPNVPLPSVAAAAESWGPQQLLFFMVHRDAPESVGAYLQNLRECIPGPLPVLVCREELLNQVSVPPEIHKLHSLPELEQLLEEKTTQTV